MSNYKKYKLFRSLFILLLFIQVSCSNQKFDKNAWCEREDSVFPPSLRPYMLDDLITNNKLVGLTYNELIARLGMPDNKDTNIVSYAIVVEYGTDIDPVYTKDLEFTISKDSLIMSLRIRESKDGN